MALSGKRLNANDNAPSGRIFTAKEKVLPGLPGFSASLPALLCFSPGGHRLHPE
ncbi:hypothetical protein ACP26C_12375 [Franconibacter helveticus 513]|uniref:hypothetical protein n=1 Tax=Franconibacter helveticus TaxID=357240 RepID=UPI0004026E84|nr:hypothetical protein [Franconibacter helveticus]